MLTFAVHARGHYELVGGGRSRVDFYMPDLMNGTRQINTSNTNAGGFAASILHTWLNNALWEAMDPHWKELITQSYTLSNDGYQTTTATKTADYFRIPSYYELYGATSTVEVDSDANEIAFTRYTDNASRIKKGNNGKGAAAIYWTRTANTGNSNSFYLFRRPELIIVPTTRTIATGSASASRSALRQLRKQRRHLPHLPGSVPA